MRPPLDHISAFIIAGGSSRRFGRDKTLYRINGVPLIEQVLRVLRGSFRDIAIIGDDVDKFSHLGLPCYPDKVKGLGPIGGLYTALMHCPTERAFAVAADMPHLNAGLIEYMASIAEPHDVVVPRINGFYEALHAIYSTRCLDHVRRWIDRGEKQIIGFYNGLDVREVGPEEISRFADIAVVFRNINYLNDLNE